MHCSMCRMHRKQCIYELYMEEVDKEFIKDFKRDLHSSFVKNIEHRRSHLHRMMLLSGAIAAFSIPVYSSPHLSETQHTFISFALVFFLLTIMIGVPYLSYVLSEEARRLSKMQIAVEEKNHEIFQSIEKEKPKRDKFAKQSARISKIIHILFVGGTVSFIVVIILGQY